MPNLLKDVLKFSRKCVKCENWFEAKDEGTTCEACRAQKQVTKLDKRFWWAVVELSSNFPPQISMLEEQLTDWDFQTAGYTEEEVNRAKQNIADLKDIQQQLWDMEGR